MGSLTPSSITMPDLQWTPYIPSSHSKEIPFLIIPSVDSFSSHQYDIIINHNVEYNRPRLVASGALKM